MNLRHSKDTDALNQFILKQNECHAKEIDRELVKKQISAVIQKFNTIFGAFSSKAIFANILTKVTKSDR